MSELCLKDQVVLTLKDVEGVPSSIVKINNEELLPLCLRKECSFDKLMEWMNQRNIPQNREGLEEMKAEFGDSFLVNKNYASLSDHYWLKKRTENYKKVNYFTNLYSRDIGDMAFKPWVITHNRINSDSPDLTTNGILKKRWVQNPDKTSYLVKAESKITHQEPLNEVLVAVLAEQLGIIDCVKYELHIEGTTMCSKGDNFITWDTDLVPASYIYYQEERQDNETVFDHLLRMCELFDIPNAEDFLNAMVFIDNITANEDRNLSNIAFIRDINTMKFIGPAPLFDCAAAYWNTKKINDAVKSKLFGDVEVNVFNAMKNKCDLNLLTKDYGFKKLIQSYPCITEVKKENLIAEIKNRNNRLCNLKKIESKGLYNDR